MAIYAIADLHLSFGNNKPMDVFGENWKNHYKKIKNNWIATDEDLVVLPGDFSWALNLEDTYEDFKYLSGMPGKKILLKGNHDYWWTSITKLDSYLKKNRFDNISFLHNNSYFFENKIIAGTRGWSELEENSDKVLKRENIRLKISIEDGIKKYGKDKEVLVFMHFPPFNQYEETDKNFIDTMKQYNVKKCIYGHIHGEATKDAFVGEYKGIEFKLVSADSTNFNLIKIN